MKKLGIYVHIPFCVKKCDYCDFLSYAGKEEYVKGYIEEIKKEIANKLSNIDYKEYEISTIYMGGGTPSFIDSKYIVDILSQIRKYAKNILQNVEITIELNPGTVTKEKLENYEEAGINRLSIGLQETNNEILKSIGRIHTYEDFLDTYNLARSMGFNNVNVDLMIGLPNQRIENIKNSLEEIIKLNPEHISAYSLILEEKTLLYRKCGNNEITLPDEELERNMYWYVKNILENNGYKHYEISNFAKEGFESKHNLDCWNQEEYLGFGLGAHSYINRVRYSREIKNGQTPFEANWKNLEVIIHEVQTEFDMQKEYMLLGLRKINGVSIQNFKNKFGENPIFIFRIELNKLVEEELIIINGDRIKLTNKGLDLANIVWEEFV